MYVIMNHDGKSEKIEDKKSVTYNDDRVEL